MVINNKKSLKPIFLFYVSYVTFWNVMRCDSSYSEVYGEILVDLRGEKKDQKTPK